MVIVGPAAVFLVIASRAFGRRSRVVRVTGLAVGIAVALATAFVAVVAVPMCT